MDELKNTIEVQKHSDKSISQAKTAAPDSGDEGFQSTGYKIHNEITYRGVDWALNSIVGVGFAYWAQRTKAGHEWFGKPTTNAAKMIMRPFTSDEKTLEEGSKWGSRIASIIIGGTTIIPPMAYLESAKNKKAIVKGLDEMIYGKDEVANNPEFAAQYERIGQEPKKDFGTGMAARIAVLVPMFAWTMTPKLNDPTTKYVYDPIAKGTKAVAHGLGIKAPKMKATKIDGQTNWDFLHETIAMDFGLTFVYSFLHEYAFKAFAKIRGDHEAAEPEHMQTPAANETTGEKQAATPFADKVTRKEHPQKSHSHTEFLASQPQAEMGLAV